MKTQFDNTLYSSFYLWFENQLLSSRSKAYLTDIDNNFQLIQDKNVPDSYNVFQGGYRQLVAEHDVDVPNSGFFVDGNFVTGDPSISNIHTDYNNGRILVPAASGVDLTITAKSTVKEINVYPANDDEEELLMHGDFIEEGQSNPYFLQKLAELDEGTFFLPACFIINSSSENTEFSLGGEENTTNRIRVVVLSKDNYLVDAVLSYFRDTVRQMVIHIPYSEFPYGRFYGVRNFPYKYQDLVGSQPYLQNNRSLIENVIPSKITSKEVKKAINKDFVVGFLDFDLSTLRFPRL